MRPAKKIHLTEKPKLHARNKHKERYDFAALIETCPALAPFVKLNQYQDESVDFFDPAAVKMLNRALLMRYYGIEYWDVPPNYLSPPIPGRADYLHHIADLLANVNKGKIPTGASIKCLDIGVGANCIYPIVGNASYGWSFVGTEIDAIAFDSATKIVELNPVLQGKVALRLQKDSKSIFAGVVEPNERFDLTICNPPFHASLEEAQKGTLRKLSNLKGKKVTEAVLNFGGQFNELCYDGGEEKFISDMISQSKDVAKSCFWFSTLISKEANLDAAYKMLEVAKVIDYKTIHMGQGNKNSRVIAWTFFTPAQQKIWADARWNMK